MGDNGLGQVVSTLAASYFLRVSLTQLAGIMVYMYHSHVPLCYSASVLAMEESR